MASHKACGSGSCVKLTFLIVVLQVLDALVEVAFEPKMEAARLEKERKAVLAEAQMMNTIEYRSVMPSLLLKPVIPIFHRCLHLTSVQPSQMVSRKCCG